MITLLYNIIKELSPHYYCPSLPLPYMAPDVTMQQVIVIAVAFPLLGGAKAQQQQERDGGR